MKLGIDSYLEVISIDPDGERPRRKRWFELDTLLPDTRPRLATWVMRTNDIDKVTNSTDLELGVVEEMSRGTPEWQITIPLDGRRPSHGIATAVIQRKGELHPASKLAESPSHGSRSSAATRVPDTSWLCWMQRVSKVRFQSLNRLTASPWA